MNWQLLAILVVGYSVVFVLIVLSLIPGRKHLERRFQERFSRPISEDAVLMLTSEQRIEWEHIYIEEYRNSIFRRFELVSIFFHYPSIVVLSAILKRNTLGLIEMYFVTGVTYVAILYLLLPK